MPSGTALVRWPVSGLLPNTKIVTVPTATRPGRVARERRLDEKHQRGTRKRERAGKDWD